VRSFARTPGQQRSDTRTLLWGQCGCLVNNFAYVLFEMCGAQITAQFWQARILGSACSLDATDFGG